MAIIETNRKKRFKVVIRVHNKQVSKSFVRKVDAQTWEREMLHKRDAGELPTVFARSEAVTLVQLRERFLKEYAQFRQAESTRLMESGLFVNYVVPILGNADIRKLKRTDFQQLFVNLSEKHALSNGQINRIRQILSCMFSRALDWELVDVNPLASVRKLPDKNYSKEEAISYLTQEEARKLLVWLEQHDPWLYPKVRVLLNCGLRYGEMCALEPQDVVKGPQGMYLKVSRTFCRYTKVIKNRTKGGRSRMLPLGPGMSEWLGSMIEGKASDSPLLWNDLQECRHHTKFHKHFKKALKAAGVRQVRIHALRHTFAVHFLERGGHLYDLQKLLGHQSLRLTERYSHFSLAMSERTRGLVDHGSTALLTVIDGGKQDTMLHNRCTKAEIGSLEKEKAPQASLISS